MPNVTDVRTTLDGGMRTTEVGRVLADAVSSARHRAVEPALLERFGPQLIEKALVHRVPGPLLHTFRHHGVAGEGALHARAVDDAIARMTALLDVEWMAEVFAGADIDWLAFKGPVLTTIAGCDRWERPTTDLDVLVRGRDLERAIDLLVDAGGFHLDQNWELMLERVIGEVHLIMPMGTSLDLHWNLLVNESMRTMSTPDHAAIFDTARTVDLDGVEVPTFGPAETLVYSCVHACISGGHRLVWLKDVEQLVLADQPDWDDVVDVARSWGAAIQVGAIVGRTQRHLGLDVPDGVIERLVPNRALRLALELLDRRRPVADAELDESILRLATRSLGPTTWVTVERFGRRAIAFARRRLLHGEPMSATELFVERPGDGDRRRYFDAVVAASS
ncbi:nucleotidyltransferase family protein [Ilumatobacter sp.]|uniref:nucleotidyltransferase family protein n=1 Tax=Ilumatobacter sp. TaxID=1967498 RepID=UPI003B52B1B9